MKKIFLLLAFSLLYGSAFASGWNPYYQPVTQTVTTVTGGSYVQLAGSTLQATHTIISTTDNTYQLLISTDKSNTTTGCTWLYKPGTVLEWDFIPTASYGIYAAVTQSGISVSVQLKTGK